MSFWEVAGNVAYYFFLSVAVIIYYLILGIYYFLKHCVFIPLCRLFEFLMDDSPTNSWRPTAPRPIVVRETPQSSSATTPLMREPPRQNWNTFSAHNNFQAQRSTFVTLDGSVPSDHEILSALVQEAATRNVKVTIIHCEPAPIHNPNASRSQIPTSSSTQNGIPQRNEPSNTGRTTGNPFPNFCRTNRPANSTARSHRNYNRLRNENPESQNNARNSTQNTSNQRSRPRSDSNASSTSSINPNNRCVVCLSQRKNHLLIPCGHLCVCGGRANQLQRMNSNCPLCRRHFTQIIAAYT